jgi:hypothetical protein
MKKTIILSVSVLILALTSVARADISLSGYAEYYAGSADQSIANGTTNHGIDQSGMSNGTYTRITGSASTTLDSGIEVNITSTMYSESCQGSEQANCGVVNFNNAAFSTNMGTITVGETFDVGAGGYSRLTASGPGADPDAGNMAHFYTADALAQYGAANETNYADNSMKIKYNSNVYSGFSVAVGFTPHMGEDGNNTTQQDVAANTLSGNNWDNGFTDVLHVLGRYTMDMDGVGLTAAVGQITGNAGQIGGRNYNDLDELVYSVNVSYAGFAADYRKNEADNSGREAATNAGNNEGTSICGEYRMANLGLGVCQVETGFTDANNRSNSSMIRTYAAEYSLGGGANIAVVYFTDEHEANSVTNTDVDGVMTKLSIGF